MGSDLLPKDRSGITSGVDGMHKLMKRLLAGSMSRDAVTHLTCKKGLHPGSGYADLHLTANKDVLLLFLRLHSSPFCNMSRKSDKLVLGCSTKRDKTWTTTFRHNHASYVRPSSCKTYDRPSKSLSNIQNIL